MIRYIGLMFILLILFILLLIPLTHAGEFADCGYIPKRTEQYQYPEWEVLSECASYENGMLKIAKEHMANLNFEKISTARFYTSGQHFYVKTDGSFLPVIFYDNGADPYQEGLTRSLVNGKIAYFNTDFELILAPNYDWAWPFQEGRALVCKGCVPTPVEDGHTALEGGLWGYINKEGKEVVPVKYTATEVSSK
ncbi:MAG: WG repeat-containing protein [Desulfobacterales bacterium]